MIKFFLPVVIIMFGCSMQNTDNIFLSESDHAYHLNTKNIELAETSISIVEVHNPNTSILDDTIVLNINVLSEFKVGLVSHRYPAWKAWTKPVKIDSLNQIAPNDNQFFLYKTIQGRYVAMIPLSGKGFRSTIGQKDNHIIVESAMGVNHRFSELASVLIAKGDNPFKVIKDAYLQAMKFMGKGENLRTNKVFPEQFEYLGFCTWNSMYDKMNEQKLIEAVEVFASNKFPIGNLIIDDGWLDMQPNRKLNTFIAETEKFPDKLKTLIQTLKRDKGIKNVGVWHTINGYWGGLAPGGELVKQYPLYSYLDQETWLLDSIPLDTFYIADPRTERGAEFFMDWYEYLGNQGVDFVKVDNQLVVERMAKNQVPIFDFAEKLQSSLQKAVSHHFNGAVINCMDMTNDAFYNFGSSAVARTVEDYFPYKETETYNLQKGNAAAHVLSAIYNALWFGEMVYTDFDMFQSHHPDAEYHAIARALSGGPIYITDKSGMQNFDILDKLVTSDGKILRSDAPLIPTEDCLFQVQEKRLLKSFSHSGDIGLLAVFHATDTTTLTGNWKVSDLPMFEQKPEQQFALYNYKEQLISTSSFDDSHNVELDKMDVSLYWISPIHKGVALLGLLEKYNGPAAIKNIKYHLDTTTFTIADGGKIGFYAKEHPQKVIVNNKEVKTNANKELYYFSLPVGKQYAITIIH